MEIPTLIPTFALIDIVSQELEKFQEVSPDIDESKNNALSPANLLVKPKPIDKEFQNKYGNMQQTMEAIYKMDQAWYRNIKPIIDDDNE